MTEYYQNKDGSLAQCENCGKFIATNDGYYARLNDSEYFTSIFCNENCYLKRIERGKK